VPHPRTVGDGPSRARGHRAIAIGRRAIAETVIRKLRAEEIQIGSLKVHELEWPASAGPAPTRVMVTV